MITEFWIKNSQGTQKKFSLTDSYTTGYAVKEINGLYPTEVDIKTTQLSSGNRFVFNKGFRKNREINISLVYMNHNDGNRSIQTLREDILSLIKTNDAVEFAIATDKPFIYYIPGCIQKHEAQTFSDMCGSEITISCPSLFFQEASSISGGYRPRSIAITSDSWNEYQYNGTMYAPIKARFGRSAYDSSYTMYGEYTFTIQNGTGSTAVTREIKINIPQNDATTKKFYRFDFDLTADLPSFTLTGENETVDASKYVDYESIVKQTEFPCLKTGINTISVEGTMPASSVVKTVWHTARYLGV